MYKPLAQCLQSQPSVGLFYYFYKCPWEAVVEAQGGDEGGP